MVIVEAEETGTSIFNRAVDNVSCHCLTVTRSANHGIMSSNLNFVELIFVEVSGGKGIVGAQLVYGPVEALGFIARQMTAVYDPGEVVAFSFEDLKFL